MTKMELMKMLENVADEAELTFVTRKSDRDGFPYDSKAEVIKVLGGEVVTVRGKYGIETLEYKTDDLVYVEKTNLFGIKYGWYERKEG